jgi:hypothetical protein
MDRDGETYGSTIEVADVVRPQDDDTRREEVAVRSGVRGHSRRAGSLLVALIAIGCGRGPASPLPPPSSSPLPPSPAAVVAGAHTGPTAIAFVEAMPPPGSVVACNATIADCAGRIRIRLRLSPQLGGPSLWTEVTIHATNKVACFRGRVPGLVLEAGRPEIVDVVLDQVDRTCGLPLTVTHMAAVVEGVVQVASRQEWSIAYDVRP